MRLDNKTAILAKNFKGSNMRPETEEGEEGGDAGDLQPSREFNLTEIWLTKKQYEDVVGEDAFRRHFNVPASGPIELLDKSHATIWLDDVYKNCAVKFTFGVSAKEIEIDGAKIKNISIKRDGKTERACAQMKCTLQAIFPMNLTTLMMETFKGKEIRVTLRLGAKEEQIPEQRQEDLVDAAREAEEAATSENSKKGGGTNTEARLN